MGFEWVEKDLGGIKDITYSQVGITGYNTYPFEDIKIRERYKWEEYNSTDYGTHQSIELIRNNLFNMDSGAAHYRVGKNWKVQFLVYTENFDYTQDEIDDESLVDDIGNALLDSFVVFTLEEDGYISVDVNSDHTGIANFNVRKNATDWIYKDSPRVNNETQLVVLKTWHYEEVSDEEGEPVAPPEDDELWDEGNDQDYDPPVKDDDDDDDNDDDDSQDDDDDGDMDTDDDDGDKTMDYLIFFGALALVAFAFGFIRN